MMEPASHPSVSKGNIGFTIIELLVSTAIVAFLLLILISITDSTRKVWTGSRAKIEQFREARDAFEAITRRLSQATLNTYWDYHYPGNVTTNTPDAYIRQSELRFISGGAQDLTLGTSRVTHGIFFQAPLGYVTNSDYKVFRNLLNTWGFFVEYASDLDTRPTFIAGLMPARNRFRLTELMEPSEQLTLYQAEAAAGGSTAYTGKDWFTTPLGTASNRSVLAENIIALVLLPKLSPADQKATGVNYTDASLAPTYLYDSTGTGMTTLSDANLNPKNQLPPVVQVTMVAIDELSASRIGDAGMADLKTTLSGLFATVGSTADPSLPGYAKDLKTLEDSLIGKKINYRIFTSNVNIKAAKWSRNQKN